MEKKIQNTVEVLDEGLAGEPPGSLVEPCIHKETERRRRALLMSISDFKRLENDPARSTPERLSAMHEAITRRTWDYRIAQLMEAAAFCTDVKDEVDSWSLLLLALRDEDLRNEIIRCIHWFMDAGEEVGGSGLASWIQDESVHDIDSCDSWTFNDGSVAENTSAS